MLNMGYKLHCLIWAAACSVWRNPGIIGKSAPFAALFANLQSLGEPAEGSGAWLEGHPAHGREGEDDPSQGAMTP